MTSNDMSASDCLRVRDLRVVFATPRGKIRAVDGISFEVKNREVLGIVGESGSGKSVTLRSIIGLVRAPGKVSGAIEWKGRRISDLSFKRLSKIRGREISMIFQEPMTALNPVMNVGAQIRENLKEHSSLDALARKKRAIELLDQVGIPSAKSRIADYPHQFSGGMRQRVMIAIALASTPKLLLADEPTTALDVTIQDQILKLILRMRLEMQMSVLLVTHDLGVIAQTCDRVAVMYAGKIVESGPVTAVFHSPKHAYTEGLLESVPTGGSLRKPLRAIPGLPPTMDFIPSGCPFEPRCSYATTACSAEVPPLKIVAPNHLSACIHHDKLARSGDDH